MIEKEAIQANLDSVFLKISEADWRIRMLGTIAKNLGKTPKRYRAYGPYWWNLKKVLPDMDNFIDVDMAERFDYGNDSLNIMAAVMYASHRIDIGLIYVNTHPIGDAGNDGEEVAIEDSNIELMI
jgi:mRNA-degrading endonuclease HigB of HigAB toxin-antitoxin module